MERGERAEGRARTETTRSWRVKTRRVRFALPPLEIAFAGIERVFVWVLQTPESGIFIVIIVIDSGCRQVTCE